jgi:molybdenum cofactor cytidylyltransferase
MARLLREREGLLSAIVLAAGMSRRMGPRNKLLLPVDGVPLVRRSVAVVLGYPFVEVVVVTGHEAPLVEAALDGLAARVVHNPRYEEGQMTSVRAGLEACAARAAHATSERGVMVCLADQPALTSEDLETVAGAFLARDACPVLVPTFGGARGNPIVLGWSSLESILSRGGNFGCRQFVAKNADVVTTFEMPNDHVLTDVDRPEDYAALGAPSARV